MVLETEIRILHMSIVTVVVLLSRDRLLQPMDYSSPGFSVQARILDGLPFPTPGDHCDPGLLHLLLGRWTPGI